FVLSAMDAWMYLDRLKIEIASVGRSSLAEHGHAMERRDNSSMVRAPELAEHRMLETKQ
uniref:Uncharacterized protein n=1 Tax=Aegilops tauschii subsp. strangulata TaxID=200361 RepID=A0A453H584_AEGTS